MADSVKIKITGDDSHFRKTLSGLGSVAKNALGGIVAGAGAASAAIGAISVKSLTLAGDLEQNIGGAEAVFGDLGDSISKMSAPMQKYNKETKSIEKSTASLETISKDAYKNMGLSQADYLATVNKMGSLMKGSGMETQEALNLSSEAMQRAADVASIMGIDIEWAMESVAGAAKGNFTMMDNLGVAMNDTNLQAYALEKGIKKSTQAMTQQEKIGLAMQMFLEKTSYAAGNYAKENETLAGSLSTAKAAMTNFLSGAGDIDAVIDSFENFLNVVGRMGGELGKSLASQLTANMGKIGDLFSDVLGNIAISAPEVVNIALDLINALVSAISANAASIGNSGAQIVAALASGIAQATPTLAGAAIQIISSFASSLLTQLPTIISQVVGAFGEFDSATTAVLGLVAALTMLSGVKVSNGIVNIISSLTLAFDEARVYGQAVVASFTSLSTATTLLSQNMSSGGIIIAALTGKMSLSAAATALWTKATQALNAAWKANPFGVVAAGVIALGTALYAGSKAYDEYLEKNSEAIQQAKEYSKEAEKNAENAKKLSDSVQKNAEAFEDSKENILAEAHAEEQLVNKLYDLAQQENLTAAQKQKMASIVEQLNGSIDGLNLKLNEETGALNMTKDAVMQLIEKKKLLAQENAAAEMYTEAQAEAYKIQIDLELNQETIDDIEKKITEIEDRMFTSDKGVIAGVSQFASQEDSKTRKELITALQKEKETREELLVAQEENNKLVEKTGQLWDETSTKIAQNAEITEENTQKTSEGNKKVSDSTKEATKSLKEGSEAVKQYGETLSNGEINPDFVGPIQTEVNEATNTLQQGGQKNGAAYSEGIESGVTPPDLQTPVQEGANGAVSTAQSTGSEVGSAFTASLEGSINGQPLSLTLTIDSSNFTGMGQAKGSEFITSAVSGIQAGTGQLSVAMSNAFQGGIVAAQGKRADAVQTGEYIGQGFADGIRNKKSEAVNAAVELVEEAIEAANAKAKIASPSKETTKSGEFIAEGYEVGIEHGTAGAVAAAENLVSETSAVIQRGTEGLISDMQTTISNAVGIVPSPGTGVTRFRVDTLFGGDPTKQSEYYSKFLKDEYDKEVNAFIDAQKEALIAYDEAVKNGVYSDILRHQLEENMFPKTDDSIMAFFDQRIKLLDTMLGLEVIAEEEYYQKLEQYMGEYLKNGTEQWYEYTQKVMEHKSEVAAEAMSENIEQAEEFAEFEKDVLGKAHDMTLFEEMDFYRARMQRYEGYIQEVLANTELMEKDKKELIEEYESQITDDLYDYVEVYVDAYSEAAEKITEKEKELTDDIIASRDDMISTLADYGTLFFQYDLPTIDVGGIEHTPTITELSDISKQNEFKREYKRLMDEVMSREGFADGFFSELEGLSVPDAVDFMRALLDADDKGFKKFMSDWAEGNALDKAIAESFYDPASVQENEELIEMRKAFEDEFGKLPDGFLEIGSKSAECFESGFIEKIKQVMEDAKGMISATFSGVFLPQLSFSGAPGSSGNYTVNYYLQPSNGESTRQQLTATENAATLNKARGGYY